MSSHTTTAITIAVVPDLTHMIAQYAAIEPWLKTVNNLNVGRNPDEVLRLLDGLQTDELCPCNRAVGGATL